MQLWNDRVVLLAWTKGSFHAEEATYCRYGFEIFCVSNYTSRKIVAELVNLTHSANPSPGGSKERARPLSFVFIHE